MQECKTHDGEQQADGRPSIAAGQRKSRGWKHCSKTPCRGERRPHCLTLPAIPDQWPAGRRPGSVPTHDQLDDHNVARVRVVAASEKPRILSRCGLTRSWPLGSRMSVSLTRPGNSLATWAGAHPQVRKPDAPPG